METPPHSFTGVGVGSWVPFVSDVGVRGTLPDARLCQRPHAGPSTRDVKQEKLQSRRSENETARRDPQAGDGPIRLWTRPLLLRSPSKRLRHAGKVQRCLRWCRTVPTIQRQHQNVRDGFLHTFGELVCIFDSRKRKSIFIGEHGLVPWGKESRVRSKFGRRKA